MKKLLILNLAEEIHDYVGDTPVESWDADSNIAEYGTPDELAFSAAYAFFGDMGDTLVEDEMAMIAEETGGKCYNEPHDEFYYGVLHTLNTNVALIREERLVHLTDVVFSYPNLVLELSTEMDMNKYHAKLEPPDER